MSPLPVDEVLVVGGGIGGLSSAIALSQRGARVTVVERHGNALGASIIVGHRAVYALEELGVLERCLQEGARIEADEPSWWTYVFNREGERQPVPPPKLPADGLPSSVFLYRPVLARILADKARELGVNILVGHSFASIEPSGEAELTTGERKPFDLIVGADGINSSVRRLVFPEAGEPHYTGAMSFRVMLADPPADWFSGLHVAPGGMVVTTVLPGGLFYLAASVEMENRHVDQDEARELVRSALNRYASTTMFAAVDRRITDDVSVIVAPYEWIWVSQPWHRERVVLVGDAAHATTPNIGSGGSMAIEDGVVLADALEAAGNLEPGLTAYERRRLRRTKLVVDASVQIMHLQQQVPRQPLEEAKLRAAAIEQLAAPY